MSAVALPEGKFGAILADPPWAFKSWSGKHSTPHRTANDHYRTMSIEEMMTLPIGDIAAPDCALIMWIVGSHIPQAIELAAAWGFEFKTDLLYWEKMGGNHAQDDFFTGPPLPRISMGYYTRKQIEPAYLFTRGKPKRLSKGVRQLIRAPRREHSRKPDEQYERIEQLFAGPYLELFARAPRKGWTVWGNQTDKFAAIADTHPKGEDVEQASSLMSGGGAEGNRPTIVPNQVTA